LLNAVKPIRIRGYTLHTSLKRDKKTEKYLWKFLDEVVCVSLLARLLNFLFGDTFTSESNILVDRATEQHGLLTNNSDPVNKQIYDLLHL
jgi:hypothetical protein